MRAPRYLGIVLGAMVLYIVGGFYVIAGGIVVVSALKGGGGAAHSAANFDTMVTGMFTPLFALGAAVIGAGLLFILVGSVAMAIRDIARNSFGH